MDIINEKLNIIISRIDALGERLKRFEDYANLMFDEEYWPCYHEWNYYTGDTFAKILIRAEPNVYDYHKTERASMRTCNKCKQSQEYVRDKTVPIGASFLWEPCIVEKN